MGKQNNNSMRCRKKSRESGMTLIELMIAMFVLTIGMLGSILLIASGMQSNTRNRTDTAGTVLDQEVMEEFATLKNYPKTGSVRIWDCTIGNNTTDYHLASLVDAASPAGAGAALDSLGNIDWTQAAPTFATSTATGYAMRYTTCSGDIYEVRWNVMQVGNNTANVNTRISLLTVSSRQIAALSADANAGARNNGILYARPTTLRTLIEQ
jgi:prepilin-type N-terminal cleavage/methylation domain-containing protein